MFAVELFFNKEFDEYVRNIWKEFDTEGISEFMNKFDNLNPHITLALYRDLPNIEEFTRLFNDYFMGISTIKLKFVILATFPTTGTIFLAPTISEEFFGLHRDYFKELEQYNDQAISYYSPDQWNPHCTLATRLSREGILTGLNKVLTDFQPRLGIIEKVSLVKIETSERINRNITIIQKSLES